ncbi:MAG TPA: hypothetical protein PK622_13635, partial [Saprospiraceae bacterium]|nr:hypothetical protein [Saprospiraceae bacterium]
MKRILFSILLIQTFVFTELSSQKDMSFSMGISYGQNREHMAFHNLKFELGKNLGKNLFIVGHFEKLNGSAKAKHFLTEEEVTLVTFNNDTPGNFMNITQLGLGFSKSINLSLNNSMYFTGGLSYNFIKSSKLTGLILDEVNSGITYPHSSFATYKKFSLGIQTGFQEKLTKNSRVVIL